MSEFTEDIRIQKAIAHAIPAGSGSIEDLRLSPQTIQLDDVARRALAERLTSTLGNASKHLNMVFEAVDATSAFPMIKSAIYSDEEEFIRTSQLLAARLNTATTNPRTPASLMLVLQATTGTGVGGSYVLYILKAEAQDGFKTRTLEDGTVTIELITDLFLSKAQKMFKVAAIATARSVDLANAAHTSFRTIVFDENLHIGNASSAARYFTNKFLGLTIPNDSDAITQRFFEHTKDFANTYEGLNAAQRYQAITGLHALLQSNSGTVSPQEFADNFLPLSSRESYLGIIESIAVPVASFSKNLRYIEKRIAKRSIDFVNGVAIKTDLQQSIEDLVEILKYDEDGSTIVKVKSQIKQS